MSTTESYVPQFFSAVSVVSALNVLAYRLFKMLSRYF